MLCTQPGWGEKDWDRGLIGTGVRSASKGWGHSHCWKCALAAVLVLSSSQPCAMAGMSQLQMQISHTRHRVVIQEWRTRRGWKKLALILLLISEEKPLKNGHWIKSSQVPKRACWQQHSSIWLAACQGLVLPSTQRSKHHVWPAPPHLRERVGTRPRGAASGPQAYSETTLTCSTCFVVGGPPRADKPHCPPYRAEAYTNTPGNQSACAYCRSTPGRTEET